MVKIGNKMLCENCFAEAKYEPCPVCGYSRADYVRDPMTLAVGSILGGRYAIGRVIGKGGFGVTYLAFDTKLECKVAIKEYYPFGLAVRNPGSTQVSVSNAEAGNTFRSGADKFYDEARLVAKFNGNPNIVSVHDFFYENDTVYFTMGYLDGMTLKSYIKECGALSPEQAAGVAEAVSNALMAAHSLNVLHRDISPDNIMVCRDGTIKLLDFGAARQVVTEGSQSLSVILKQGFAPLEQYQKKGKQGPWTDIYSLGATLYHALTLDSLDDPMSRLEDDEEYNSNSHNIPEELWKMIQKATALRAQDRYQDIFEFRKDLNSLSLKPVMPEVPAAWSGEREGSRTSGTFAGTGNAMPEGTQGGGRPEGDSVGRTMPLQEEDTVGRTMPLQEKDTVGRTMPLQEEDTVGRTMPLREEDSIGKTMPLREEDSIGKTMPLREEDSIGKTMPLQEEDSNGKAMQPQERRPATEEVQTQDTPKSKKKGIGAKPGLKYALMAAAAVAVVALAAFLYVNTREYRYETYGDYVVIKEYRRKDSVVEIPSEIKGKPVKRIEHAFAYNADIVEVIVPEGVTEIGIDAFQGCTNLERVELPDSVMKIDRSAFMGCTKLREIHLPEGITEIGNAAFVGCSSLESIELPDGVTTVDGFGGCRSLTNVKFSDSTTEIRGRAFKGCSSLTSIELPDSVTKIGEEAFMDCIGLTHITIPEHAEVADNAFDGCDNLNIIRAGSAAEISSNSGAARESGNSGSDASDISGSVPGSGNSGDEQPMVDIPDTIPATDFDYNVYNDYIEITGYRGSDTQLEIPSEIGGKPVKKIGDGAFKEYKDLTNVKIPEGVTEIGSEAFYDCWELANVEIPISVTKIGSRAFRSCLKLPSIEIPNSVTELGETVFAGCNSLADVKLSDSITEIGRDMFNTCGSLESIVIPNGVTKISSSAFYKCSSLISVDIPNTVRKIDNFAFSGCTSLTIITIPLYADIADNAFDDWDSITVRTSE